MKSGLQNFFDDVGFPDNWVLVYVVVYTRSYTILYLVFPSNVKLYGVLKCEVKGSRVGVNN